MKFRYLLLIIAGMGALALSTSNLDDSEVGFQPEPELRHILKNK